VSTANSGSLEEVRVGVRLKISALWIAMLFLFAYGDIFGFFKPGQIEEVSAGEIASVMVFLSLVLRPKTTRWANIVLPILYVVSIVASVIGEDWAYFFFLSAVESALLLLIIWYAWTWPRHEEILGS
jgi:hypothetical protein